MAVDEDKSDEHQFAAIDLGSNSFHLVLARRNERGRLNLVDRRKEYVRLAAGLDEDNNLSIEAQERALATLRRFGERVGEVPHDNFRAVGTNTLRKARNSSDFLRRAQEALGRPIDIISGLEEARLIYRGVALDCDLKGRRIVIDIGGGSTEIILGEGADAQLMDSLYMGCVSYTRRFFPDGKITAENFRAAELAAGRELGSVVRKYRRKFEHAVASSGTAGAVYRVIRATGIDEQITATSLRTLRDRLMQFDRCNEIELPEISRERAQVLPGGLSILIAVCEQLRIGVVERSDFALREGVLVEMQGRAVEEDVSEGTVERLMERFDVDVAHAERVAETALSLFDQVAVEQGWGMAQRRGLRWAAMLHEVGLFMGYSGHHKHGAYLVANGELPGFSQQQKLFVSSLIGAHRGRLSSERVSKRNTGSTPLLLIAIFRIAIRMRRRRSRKALPDLQLSISKKTLTLCMPADWIESRPLTQEDLKQEANACRDVGLKLKLKRVELD